MGIQYDHFGIPLQAYIDYVAPESNPVPDEPEEDLAELQPDTASEVRCPSDTAPP